MTPVDISELLEHLYAAYPQSRIVEDTPKIWFVHLASFDRIDAEAAAYRWIDTEARFPSIAQFVTACQRERRLTAEADNPRAQSPLLESGEEMPADPAQAKTFVGALRASLDVAKRGGGADAVAATFAEHAPTRFDARRILYRCRCGEGQGWITEESGTVRPCAECQPEMHARWLGGHLALGHRCPDCVRSHAS